MLIILLPLVSPAGNKTGKIKGSFSGIVTDGTTGLPLSGVSVYISGTRTGSSTDAKGYFFISNIPEGSHLVEFSHVGYGTLAEQVLIIGDLQKNIQLFSAILENNAVIVTGVSRAQPAAHVLLDDGL